MKTIFFHLMMIFSLAASSKENGSFYPLDRVEKLPCKTVSANVDPVPLQLKDDITIARSKVKLILPRYCMNDGQQKRYVKDGLSNPVYRATIAEARRASGKVAFDLKAFAKGHAEDKAKFDEEHKCIPVRDPVTFQLKQNIKQARSNEKLPYRVACMDLDERRRYRKAVAGPEYQKQMKEAELMNPPKKDDLLPASLACRRRDALKVRKPTFIIGTRG